MLDHVQGTPGAPGGYYTAIPVPVYPPAEAPISIEGAIASQPVQVRFTTPVWRAEHTAECAFHKHALGLLPCRQRDAVPNLTCMHLSGAILKLGTVPELTHPGHDICK